MRRRGRGGVEEGRGCDGEGEVFRKPIHYH